MKTLFMSFNHKTFLLNLFFLSMIPLFYGLKPSKSSANQALKTMIMKMSLNTQKPTMKKQNPSLNPSTNEEKHLSFLMLMISMINLNSLLPLSFPLTSHFFFNIPLILSLWSKSLTSSLSKNSMTLTHLCPYYCPMILAPFMILIESMSLMMRPLTLLLRLTINMMSGHMIISMMTMLSLSSMSVMIALTNLILSFLVLKITVCFIQSYIMMTLSTMYFKESAH